MVSACAIYIYLSLLYDSPPHVQAFIMTKKLLYGSRSRLNSSNTLVLSWEDRIGQYSRWQLTKCSLPTHLPPGNPDQCSSCCLFFMCVFFFPFGDLIFVFFAIGDLIYVFTRRILYFFLSRLFHTPGILSYDRYVGKCHKAWLVFTIMCFIYTFCPLIGI